MKRSLAILVLAAALVSPRALCQLQPDRRDTIYSQSPVIVTATRALERITPVTFTDLKREQLAQRYSVQDVPVLLSELPSITFYSENGNGIGYNYINLRGFDQRRLSVMVNGIPQNDPEDHNVYWIDFPDLMASTDNIQVQRGAGSAFYGPPAIGGSVNLTANPFRAMPAVTLESMFGFQELGADGTTPLSTRKFSASVNSGLVNQRYMFYGRLGKITTSGYREKSNVDLNSYFLGAVRFDENMTTRFNFYGGPFSDGLVFNGLPKFVNNDKNLRRMNWGDWNSDSTWVGYSPSVTKVISKNLNDTIFVVPRRAVEVENFSQPHFELQHEWRLSPSTRFTNTFFLILGNGYFDYDASWADTSLLRIGDAYGVPATANPTNTLIRGFVGNKQWGWLPRVELEHASGTLTVGAELRIHRSTHWGKVQYAEGLPIHFDPDDHFYEYNGEKDIASLYGHELYRLDENMTLMADLQFVYNRYGIAHERFLHHEFSLPYYFLNPRLGLNINLDESWSTYFSLALTSREPTLRNLYAAEDSYFGATPQFKSDTTGGTVRYDFTQPLAKPERLFDVEFGLAQRSASARFTANFFWMEFTDELVKSGQVDIFGQPVTGNAERSRHLGVELDGEWSVNSDWSLSGNVSVSENRLVRYAVYNDTLALISLDGNPIAGFPDALGNLRASFSIDWFSASLAGKYVGAFYTDNFRNESNKNDSYVVVNCDATCRIPFGDGSEMILRGEIRNLLNRLYLMGGEGNAFFPAAERNYLLGITVRL
ncbi:MAG: TonB-dependent receptor [Bacteroidota bacterium]